MYSSRTHSVLNFLHYCFFMHADNSFFVFSGRSPWSSSGVIFHVFKSVVRSYCKKKIVFMYSLQKSGGGIGLASLLYRFVNSRRKLVCIVCVGIIIWYNCIGQQLCVSPYVYLSFLTTTLLYLYQGTAFDQYVISCLHSNVPL